MMTMSVGDLLDDWFENDALKGAYASTGVVGVWAGPRTPGTAYNLLHHELGELDGVERRLGPRQRRHGRDLRGDRRQRPRRRRDDPHGRRVASIDVAGGRVTGVTLAAARRCTRRSCSPARTRRRPCSTSSAASTSPTRSSRTCAATAPAAGR